jgi:hypothetical protein
MEPNQNNPIRPDRTYNADLDSGDGSKETITIEIPTGTEEEQNAAAHVEAEKRLEDWVRGGSWGDEGASVPASYILHDIDSIWQPVWIEVDIAADHSILIGRVMRNDGCGLTEDAHDWSAEGCGGCKENQGVFSNGGTALTFITRCTRCGLQRTENVTGSQRNAGDCDTVSYSHPDNHD